MAVKKIGEIGDVNPIEYGGGPVLKASGETPWVEYFDGLESYEDAPKEWDDDYDEKIATFPIQIYRVDLEANGKDFLSWYDWVNWNDVARTNGQDVDAYSAKNLKTPMQRARAVQDATDHYGWFEFDQYPLTLTVAELRKRWGE